MSGIKINQDAFANLKPKQRKFIRYLAAEPDSVTKAAEKAGVTPTTAVEWLKRDPNVRAALAEAEFNLFQDLARRQLGLAHRAVDRLADILDDDTVSVPQKIRAIDTALTHTVKFYSIVLQVQTKTDDTQQTGDDWMTAEADSNGDDDAGEAEAEADDPDQDNT